MLKFFTVLIFFLAAFGGAVDAREVRVSHKETGAAPAVAKATVSSLRSSVQEHRPASVHCVGCALGSRNGKPPGSHVPVQVSGKPRQTLLREDVSKTARVPVGKAIHPEKVPEQAHPGTDKPLGRAKRQVQPETMEERWYSDDHHDWDDHHDADDHHHYPYTHGDPAVGVFLIVVLVAGGLFFLFILVLFAVAERRRGRQVARYEMDYTDKRGKKHERVVSLRELEQEV